MKIAIFKVKKSGSITAYTHPCPDTPSVGHKCVYYGIGDTRVPISPWSDSYNIKRFRGTS